MSGDRAAYLRLEQRYGELLADFRRDQADLAAEYDAKIAAGRRLRKHQPGSVDRHGHPAFDEDDFANNTWLH